VVRYDDIICFFDGSEYLAKDAAFISNYYSPIFKAKSLMIKTSVIGREFHIKGG
jgi:hypothetical protein